MSSYRIGVSVREITPPADLIKAGRIYLWGWGHREKPATGVRDPIWARACAICDAHNTCIVLVSLDLCALDPEFVKAVRDQIARSRGIPAQNVTINVTHTHSAPVTVAIPTWNPGVDRPDPDYMAFLENQVIATIEEAIDRRTSAVLSFAGGKITIGSNRHFGAGGAYDQTLDVIRATDTYGNIMAVAFFHGCHPIALRGLEISSDYPGAARGRIEEWMRGGAAIFLHRLAGGFSSQFPAYAASRHPRRRGSERLATRCQFS